MPLSREQTYDELNGEEAMQVLVQRVKDMLSEVPDFQKHLTLPRVKMEIDITLFIYGRRQPKLEFHNELTLSTAVPEAELETAKELVAHDAVNADTGVPVKDTPFDGTGDPPDQVREENGLTVLEPVKSRHGITQQKPVPRAPEIKPKEVDGVKYAAFHTLKRPGPVVRGFLEYEEGSEPIAAAPPGDHASIKNRTQPKDD